MSTLAGIPRFPAFGAKLMDALPLAPLALASERMVASVARRHPSLFARLGASPKFVNESIPASLAGLAAGKIDAFVLIGASTTRSVADFGKGGHFHVIAAPWSPEMREGGYAPVRLTAKDRPNLIEANENVDTVAAPMALVALDAAPGSNRATQDGALVAAMFEKFDALQGAGTDPSWRDINLAATLDWPRLPAANDWIEAHRPAAAPALETFRQAAKTAATAQGGPASADADKLYQALLQARGAQP